MTTIRTAPRRLPKQRKREEGDRVMSSKSFNRLRTVFAHVLLIFLSFLCLFFFYILIINATHSHAELQRGFYALPGTSFLKNFNSVANNGEFPMMRGILNSLIVSGCSAAICIYFSALTAYGLYAYDSSSRRSRLPLL